MSSPQIPLVAQSLGERFAAAGFDLALVGGSVRDLILARPVNDLDFTTDATPEQTERVLAGWADATWDVGRAFGTIGARHGDDVVEVTTYRAEAYDARLPQAGGRVRHEPGRRPGAPGLHRERDGPGAAGRGVRGPARRADRPGAGGAAHAGHTRVLVHRRPAADDAGGPVRRPARLRGRARGADGDGGDGGPAVDRVGRAGARRADQAAARAEPAGRAAAAGGHRAGRGVPARAAGAASWRSTSTTGTRTSTSTRSPCSTRPSRWRTTWCPGPTWCCGWRRCCTTSASRRPAGSSPAAGCRSTTTRWSGRSSPAKRLKALRFDTSTVKQVSRLVELHLRFHGYGGGEWTDSAVRRYVTRRRPAAASGCTG